MATYTIDFTNNTDSTWVFCVYQELPESPGLDSVAWKQTRVPRSGQSGVQWIQTYQACIANYRQTGPKGVYKASQMLNSELGKAWKCEFKDEVQQLFEDGSTTAGQLLIRNVSGQKANLAIGVDRDIALVKSNVLSGNSAQFSAKPKYYVALFTDLVQGEVISGNQIHGPLPVVFEGGITHKSFVAEIQGETFIFKEEGSNMNFSISLRNMEERIKMLEAAKN